MSVRLLWSSRTSLIAQNLAIELIKISPWDPYFAANLLLSCSSAVDKIDRRTAAQTQRSLKPNKRYERKFAFESATLRATYSQFKTSFDSLCLFNI